MYAFVSGTLVEKHLTVVIIEAGGIGYEIHVPTSTFEKLPEVGKPVKLFTHHHVREDAALLYGFASRPEKRVFQVMLGVSGIGPKLALAALSAMQPQDLRDHVVRGDTAILTSIPGVGRKTAERLVVELRDRFAELDGLDGAAPARGEASGLGAARADALAALESLGFSRAAAEKSLQRVMKNHPDATATEDLIRLVLRDQ